MLILWIRKTKTGDQTCHQKNGQSSFQKHDENMKRFRLTHPRIKSTGSKDIMTTDGAILAPVQTVKLASNSQN
jgi:hypothetical protein